MEFDDERMRKALAQLTEEFSSRDLKGLSLQRRQACMAHRLVFLALAHIDVIAPRFLSAINYCDMEGLDQGEYLMSLVETKFGKGCYIVDDDDDDGGSPVGSEAKN